MLNLSEIEKYLKNSLINGKICRFAKREINIFIQQISANIPNFQKENYYQIIRQAVNIWNNYAPVKFNITASPQNADIIINWTKVGIKFEGMCKFPSIVVSEIRKVSIEIGLPNTNSPKIINDATILHTALHELGHAMGLGHGVDENDIMFVPHTKTLHTPSENDIYVLQKLYKNPVGTIFENIQK